VAQLTEALEGHCMRDHERFLIRSSLRHLACLQEETEEMDAEILRRMQTAPFQEPFLLLQTIPGIGQLAAASILAETGTDLSPFPTAEKIASWAGLCPGNRESAGKRKGSQTTKGNPYLRCTLVQSAWAAARKRGSIFQLRFSPHFSQALISIFLSGSRVFGGILCGGSGAGHCVQAVHGLSEPCIAVLAHSSARLMAGQGRG